MAAHTPEELIRINKIRQSIIYKILEVFKNNPKLKEEELYVQAEIATQELFDHFHQTPGPPPAKGRPRSSKRENRKDHVGRFFLFSLEKELRKAGIQECFIPVFAESLQSLIGEEPYEEFSRKIRHLLDFAAPKGYNYDQVLQSKPGQEISQSIIQLYQSELKNTPGFSEWLKVKLDEALINKFGAAGNESLDMDRAIQQAFEVFTRLIGADMGKDQ